MILIGYLINFNALDKNLHINLFSIFSIAPVAFNLMYKITKGPTKWDLKEFFGS